ncbi:MAG TPA: YciI family protein [Acidimicrobiia bacterium]|nr:YciI family protein [Acidimicrobiia bacterium]
MPKYAALIYGEESDPSAVSPEEMQQVMSDYMEFGQVNGESLAGGEALHPTSTATTIQVEGGKGGNAVFTDGPFAETKEALGGFYIIDVPDLDAALKVAQQIPGAWHGRVEVRPVMEFDEQGNQIA